MVALVIEEAIGNKRLAESIHSAEYQRTKSAIAAEAKVQPDPHGSTTHTAAHPSAAHTRRPSLGLTAAAFVDGMVGGMGQRGLSGAPGAMPPVSEEQASDGGTEESLAVPPPSNVTAGRDKGMASGERGGGDGGGGAVKDRSEWFLIEKERLRLEEKKLDQERALENEKLGLAKAQSQGQAVERYTRLLEAAMASGDDELLKLAQGQLRNLMTRTPPPPEVEVEPP